MEDTASSSEKRIVEQLSFGAKTSKRVVWEAWDFTVEGPYQVRVTNASWGFQKDDHSYVVGVKERDGLVMPAECGCKADRFREEYDCKHKVALATVGGPTVLNAATAFEDTATTLSDSSPQNVTTAKEKLHTDGGTVTTDDESETCPNGDAQCDGPEGDGLPCFACYEGESQ